jgi:uncharacterized protein
MNIIASKKASRDFQLFVKPTGSKCNLDCSYCYYLEKEQLYPETESFRMPDDLLEKYIIQHFKACADSVIRFSWHGGEPTILGLEYFRNIVGLQQKHQPDGQRIENGIQTNGVLLDENWCRFFKEENFSIGLSLDGPKELHNKFRRTKNRKPSFAQTKRGLELLVKYEIDFDILCVVNSDNVKYPLQIYKFFKENNAKYVSFLPLVEQQSNLKTGVSSRTVNAEEFGEFLCTIFDEWITSDIGKIKIQIFEEAARIAFGQDHSLCIFRKTCGDIPVIEHNGDFYSCDHYVNPEHRLGNIRDNHLIDLLKNQAQLEFGNLKRDTLPRYCLECDVLEMCNGECPKNRFILTPGGDPGLNYLCTGYKRFFTHCRPFVTEVANVWHETNRNGLQQTQSTLHSIKTGRNDPCPCSSGKKFKHCCMNK